ncbi:hypothetical protein BU23DRAFT_574837 [Bimuria novae-zelandiae CBS 107.79]|uniref:Uncharacterized protein n=1 Tax=Bimuria novae-zelandiae CBS 107.79 TaxID=1447943 RepID=A0A6A5UM88_9PLEO|nr:hypothetical protein BU23DRAFT_574837 [Bimuria novae-zelandiae CBS 107.79]
MYYYSFFYHSPYRTSISEKGRPRTAAAPLRASRTQNPPALHQHRTEVSLPTDDLGDKERQISARRHKDDDVLRGRQRQRHLIILRKSWYSVRRREDNTQDAYVDTEALHQTPVSRLPSGQDDAQASARRRGNNVAKEAGTASRNSGTSAGRHKGHCVCVCVCTYEAIVERHQNQQGTVRRQEDFSNLHEDNGKHAEEKRRGENKNRSSVHRLTILYYLYKSLTTTISDCYSPYDP